MTKLQLDMIVNYKFKKGSPRRDAYGFPKGSRRKDVSGFTNILIEQFTEALERGDRIEVRGFGSWVVNHIRNVSRRNPKTLVPFIKKHCFKFRFKCSEQLFNVVNKDKEEKDEHLGVIPKTPEPMVEDDEKLKEEIDKFNEKWRKGDVWT